MKPSLPLVVLVSLLAACDSTGPGESLPTPDALVATAQTERITVTWRDIGDRETRYEVEFSTDAISWKPLKAAEPDANSITHLGVEHGVTYYYRVRACNEKVCSDWAQTSSAWVGGKAPTVEKPTIIGVGTDWVDPRVTFEDGGQRTSVYFIVADSNFNPIRITPKIFVSPSLDPGAGGNHAISQEIFGLAEGAPYQVYAFVENAAGNATSLTVGFRTSIRGAPVVQLLSPSFPVGSEIFLRASVDPSGLQTDFHFELAPIDSPFVALPQPFGSPITNLSQTNAGVSVNGLHAGVVYKYRIVASNARGTAVSDSAVYTKP